MKNLIFVISFLTMGLAASAQENCKGVQDLKGTPGALSVFEEGQDKLLVQYITNESTEQTCVIVKDQNYKPRTKNPKKDRYVIVNDNQDECSAKYIWLSKSLSATASGFVDVEFPCVGGGACAHGEPGRIDSLRCDNIAQ